MLITGLTREFTLKILAPMKGDLTPMALEMHLFSHPQGHYARRVVV